MNSRCLITLVVFAALFTCTAVQAAESPNFVVIFIDDMGYGDIGPFGSKINKTPHLDRDQAQLHQVTSTQVGNGSEVCQNSNTHNCHLAVPEHQVFHDDYRATAPWYSRFALAIRRKKSRPLA